MFTKNILLSAEMFVKKQVTAKQKLFAWLMKYCNPQKYIQNCNRIEIIWILIQNFIIFAIELIFIVKIICTFFYHYWTKKPNCCLDKKIIELMKHDKCHEARIDNSISLRPTTTKNLSCTENVINALRKEKIILVIS